MVLNAWARSPYGIIAKGSTEEKLMFSLDVDYQDSPDSEETTCAGSRLCRLASSSLVAASTMSVATARAVGVKYKIPRG
ncbi:hypothetical protein AZE42_12165, partial [Rhizopogon vesiculosus]